LINYRMQDIGGTRVIVGAIDELYELRAMCINPRSKSVTLENEHDYVVQPKPDGYRGIHLVYNYTKETAEAKLGVSESRLERRKYDALLMAK
jgi:ppGpp synthetase/RelA/SpoT-type nucleotidyltranferase